MHEGRARLECKGGGGGVPAGDTAPTMVTEPVRLGLPRHCTLPARS